MQIFKHVATFLVLLLTAGVSNAQMTADPTKWEYEVKKTAPNDYQLIFHLQLKNGWHIWSLNPGGDGFQIVPAITIDKNPSVQVKGKPKETGKATTTVMDGVEGKVTYLSGKVDYIQEVTVRGTTKITGKHTYQVCDDRMCLAPVDKDFVFEIK
jgi:thiol:disulfide interchange protein DsbD